MRIVSIMAGVATAGLVACDSNNECVTPTGCGPEMLCVANQCVGTAVEGDPWLLYLDEFRIRLDADCGICHFAGANEAGVEQGDGAWRLHSGTGLSLPQIEASYLDVRDFLSPGDPQLTSLVAYGRGLIEVEFDSDGTIQPHPAIWGSKENLGYVRLLNWLALFPEATPPADEPPGPPMIADPGGGFEGYGEGIHDLLAIGCGCHIVGSGRLWEVEPAGPDAAGLQSSFDATLAYIAPGDPEGSDLLKWARGELGAHPTIWSTESDGHVATAEWISKTMP